MTNIIQVGQTVTGSTASNVTPGTVILSQTRGTTGGAGVYVVNNSQTVPVEAMSSTAAQLSYVRDAVYGGRARALSANFTTSVASLVAAGPLSYSLFFNGNTYSGTFSPCTALNTPNSWCPAGGDRTYSQYATDLQNQINGAPSASPPYGGTANLATLGTLTGATITPATATFTASVDNYQMIVTSVGSSPLVLGGYVQPIASCSYSGGKLLYQYTGTPGATGIYIVGGTGVRQCPSQTTTEVYAILSPGRVTSGSIATGELVSDGTISTGLFPNPLVSSKAPTYVARKYPPGCTGGGCTGWGLSTAPATTLGPENITLYSTQVTVTLFQPYD